MAAVGVVVVVVVIVVVVVAVAVVVVVVVVAAPLEQRSQERSQASTRAHVPETQRRRGCQREDVHPCAACPCALFQEPPDRECAGGVRALSNERWTLCL